MPVLWKSQEFREGYEWSSFLTASPWFAFDSELLNHWWIISIFLVNNAWGYISGCSLAEWAADEKCQLLCSINVQFFSQVKAVENLDKLFLDNSYKCQNIGNVCFFSSFPFEYLLLPWKKVSCQFSIKNLFSSGLPFKIQCYIVVPAA